MCANGSASVFKHHGAAAQLSEPILESVEVAISIDLEPETNLPRAILALA
jgi:hypothetical protein